VTPGAAGWHGKLPSVSDFASRRLDARFIEIWDEELSSSLGALREQEGERWTEAYLSCPTWRFLIGPGFLAPPFDATSWTGVLMPSVDHVGRYYPLTLASSLTVMPSCADEMKSLWCWLKKLEDAAIAALQEDWSIDQLEAELFRLGLPTVGEEPEQADGFDGACASLELPPSAMAFFGVGETHGVIAPEELLPACMWCSEPEGCAAKVLRATSMQGAFSKLWTVNLVQT
jgi:type VI secretion system protein ImpM